MKDPVLEKDSDLRLPGVTVLKASAGSGKTHSLTKRLVQLLLSDRIPHNGLRQVLALTFSNNAAREMKERALQWLKDLSFGNGQSIAEIGEIVSLDAESLQVRAQELIEEILDAYTDFQIRTIDSFMTSVFKASAIDLGYAPEFEIIMEGRSLTDYAFDLFLRDVREGSERAGLIGTVTGEIQRQRGAGGSFMWDPSRILLDELREIDGRLASRGRAPLLVSADEERKAIEEDIQTAFRDLQDGVQKGLAAGLELNSGSSYARIGKMILDARDAASGQGLADLAAAGLSRTPVKKPGKSGGAKDAYEEISRLWSRLGAIVGRYASVLARSYYSPFLKVYDPFAEILGSAKRRLSRIFIDDINRGLSAYLDSSLVPDIYLRLGDRVFHYLIDEFQDTSPVQWRNLFPLVEESLSRGGSLFIVGDTKQAIYAFRDTDYRIMKQVETTDVFASAGHTVRELDRNYRSARRILDLTRNLFQERLDDTGISDIPDERARTYRNAASESGLSTYVQNPRPDAPEGYAEITVFTASHDEPPEREKILAVIDDLRNRGYRCGDIAVLAPRNEDVVRITGWLSERDIPFLSFSSLDVRRRKLTGEILALLRFLDSPVDDLSFASFLLSDVFTAAGQAGRREMRDFIFRHRVTSPLYKAFEQEFPRIWETCFSHLFRTTGYLPLYDLLCGICAGFSLFRSFPSEEATLAKILDSVRSFEGRGLNSLREFLELAEDGDEGPWIMDVPAHQDAVRVMTIHKAKGLGFPVVITVLYEKQIRINNCVLQEDGQTGAAALLRVTEGNSKNAGDLKDIYETQVLREYVNSLNTLYVGTTRAKEEFYLIGLRKDLDKPAGFPVDLLAGAAAGFAPQRVTGQRQPGGEEKSPPDAATNHERPFLPMAVTPAADVNIRDRRRGIFIHRVLRDIVYDRDLQRLSHIIEKAGRELDEAYPAQEISALIRNLVGHPGLAVHFREQRGRNVMIEQEFADERGTLYRMDRVVTDPGTVTVIDFKTGSAPDDAGYSAQVARYMAVLRPIFPDNRIRGLIAYVDHAAVREVI